MFDFYSFSVSLQVIIMSSSITNLNLALLERIDLIMSFSIFIFIEFTLVDKDSKFMLYPFNYLLVSMLFHRCHYLELSCSKSFFFLRKDYLRPGYLQLKKKKRSKKSREEEIRV